MSDVAAVRLKGTERRRLRGVEATVRPTWTDPLGGGGKIGDGDVLQPFGDWHRQRLALVHLPGTLVHLCQRSPRDEFQGRR